MFHIILTDDDPDDRAFFESALNRTEIPYTLTTFPDGYGMMLHLSRNDTLAPDFIFLDLNMATTSGMDWLREIKKHKKLKDLRTCIYSVTGHEKDVLESFELGADLYIVKPTSMDSLVRVLKEVLVVDGNESKRSGGFESFLLRE